MHKLTDFQVLANMSNSPNNTMRVYVKVDGKTREFVLTTRYREVCKYWTLDIADINGNYLLVNVPMLSMENILEPFEYLGIGGIVLVDMNNTGKAAADASELGDSVKFVWGSLA